MKAEGVLVGKGKGIGRSRRETREGNWHKVVEMVEYLLFQRKFPIIPYSTRGDQQSLYQDSFLGIINGGVNHWRMEE